MTRIKMSSQVTQQAIRASLSRNPLIVEGVKRTARAVRDHAKTHAPKRTGALRRSIKVVRHYDSTTRQVTYRVGWDRAVAFYGPMVELGTVHASAQPHLRPAADAVGAGLGVSVRGGDDDG